MFNPFKKSQPTRTQQAVIIAKNLAAYGAIGGAVTSGGVIGYRIGNGIVDTAEHGLGFVACALSDAVKSVKSRFSRKPGTQTQQAA